MKNIIIGAGEIGKAIKEVFGGEMIDKGSDLQGEYDLMFVCFPYDDSFVEEVEKYKDRFKPKETVVFSTVPIGTCSKLNAVHSPVEGKHPDLANSIRLMRRWVGGLCGMFIDLLERKGFDIATVEKPEYTEWLKLRSTTLYGLNIEFARYCKKVSDDLEMPFGFIKDFDSDYNELYEDMGLSQFKRYILDAPEGKIGGHCVVPNAKLLNEQYPDLLVKRVYENS